MKKLLTLLILAFMLAIAAAPIVAHATAPEVGADSVEDVYSPQLTTETTTEPVTPFTWAYLVTLGGATAATLLVVQFTKVPLDRVWKIPTRLFVYMVALGIMLLATAFTTGLTLAGVPLIALNAVMVAVAAMGGYEATFAKIGA